MQGRRGVVRRRGRAELRRRAPHDADLRLVADRRELRRHDVVHGRVPLVGGRDPRDSSTSDAGAVSVGSFGVVVDGAGDVVIGLSSSAPVLGYANPIDAGGLILVKLIAPYDAPLWTRSFGTTATVTPGLVTSYIAGGALAVDGMGFVAITASPSAPIDLGGATTAATGAFVLDLAP
jgi:hypothetical protein